MERARRIVSVTNLGVERDKRTFQNAATFSRLGYGSTVVEGEPSELPREDLPFELLTPHGASAPQAVDGDGRPPASHPVVERMPEPLRSAAKRLGAALLRVRSRSSLLLWRIFRQDNERTYEALPPADLYYLTFFWQFPAVWRKCRETGANFIYDANDAYWLWPGYRWYPRPFRLFLRRLECRCVERAAAFITVSEGVAGLLEERYGRRPQVVRNLHDLRVDEEAERDVRRAAGLGKDEFVVVVVGNEKPSDAVDEAMQALRSLPETVHLVLLGAGYEKHRPRARQLGVAERVHLVPPVAPTKVTSAIRTADAGLINTRAQEVHLHALPTRLFSTIAAGLPVLYPPLPEVAALAEAHQLGLPIDSEDADSIAVAVRRLSETPGLATEYRSKVERARETLNWEIEEGKLAELVSAALDGR
jgi:glycosyltransferase involved in cell wall biosynthesis